MIMMIIIIIIIKWRIFRQCKVSVQGLQSSSCCSLQNRTDRTTKMWGICNSKMLFTLWLSFLTTVQPIRAEWSVRYMLYCIRQQVWTTAPERGQCSCYISWTRWYFASGEVGSHRPELLGLITGSIYSNLHVPVSEELALANPELTLPLFSGE